MCVPYFKTRLEKKTWFRMIPVTFAPWLSVVKLGRSQAFSPGAPSSVQLRVFTLRFSKVFQILSPAANDQMIPRLWSINRLPNGQIQRKTYKITLQQSSANLGNRVCNVDYFEVYRRFWTKPFMNHDKSSHLKVSEKLL